MMKAWTRRIAVKSMKSGWILDMVWVWGDRTHWWISYEEWSRKGSRGQLQGLGGWVTGSTMMSFIEMGKVYVAS